MKPNLNENYQAKPSKKRWVLIGGLVIVLLGLAGFITYQTLELLNTDPDTSNFEARLEELTTVEQREISEESDPLIVSLESPEISVYGNQLTQKSPFQSLLQAESEEESEESAEQETREEELTGEELKQKVKERLKTELKIKGILESGTNRVAIVQYGDLDSQIVREDEEFSGLKVKEIRDDDLVVEDKDSEFVYTFGGEED